MTGLSRRAFLGATGTLALAWSLPYETLGSALAARATPGEAPSTLQQTIRLGARQQGKYRALTSAPGEPHVARYDLLGRVADATRSARQRSLLYFGHLSDIHIIDAQTPARLEPLIEFDHSTWEGAFRPQDTLTTQVAAEMVRSVSDMRISPVTGAPLAATFVTGDSADMVSLLETRWYIDLLDGLPIVPNSGAADRYEGVQLWAETFWAYHPERPTGDWFGDYGFPELPGLLTAAVTGEVDSGGLPTPWYTVYGNHDTTYFGTFGIPASLREFAVGGRKFFDWKALGLDFVENWTADSSAIGEALHALSRNVGRQLGSKPVTPDPDRKLLEQREFMTAHFDTQQHPGPIGHGFTQENLNTGRTYWSADVNPFVRAFGLDTCNQIAGPDGAVPQSQFNWLKRELAKAQSDGKLVLIFSHHNSFTLENDAQLATEPERLVHAEELVALLLKFSNVVAWLNGHTHINTITPHERPEGGGFWEITTASCIDFPQQQQVVELVDNQDGTLSIFTTALDHSAPAQWSGDYSQTGLASLSRELAANNWANKPAFRIGSELDRNTELLVPAPFDLSRITDAQLEQAQLSDRARLVAWERGW